MLGLIPVQCNALLFNMPLTNNKAFVSLDNSNHDFFLLRFLSQFARVSEYNYFKNAGFVYISSLSLSLLISTHIAHMA